MIDQGKMSAISKKEQIDCTTAAKFVVKKSLDDSRLYWDDMKAEIINYEQFFSHVTEEWVQYEFILAAIVANMLELYNLFEIIKGERGLF